MIQLSLNVLLVMDCVTARCGSQVQPTKMTLARQRVLSSSEVRASDLEHGGSWVRIPSGAQIFFCVLLWSIRYISLYFLYKTLKKNQDKLTVRKRFLFSFFQIANEGHFRMQRSKYSIALAHQCRTPRRSP